MGMINRLRRGIAAMRLLRQPDAGSAPETLSFSAAIPLGAGGAPLWQIDVQMISEPHADGEKLRLRARVQTNFASALRPSLDARVALADQREQSLAERAGSLVQRSAARMLALPGVRTLAEPLLENDFNTWIEIQTSTASLDAGSSELIPQSERLAALGIQPKRAGEHPVAETWSGQSADGIAQVSLLQLDKRHLPPRLARRLGDKPFQLAAAIVNTIQQKA
jgi:hypothetical protein